MKRKIIAVATALALALGAAAPTASAYDRDRHGYYGRGYDRHYDRGRRGNHDDGEAVAAGVIGLVLGMALGAAASQPRQPRQGCYDRCGPPPGYYNQGYQQQYYPQQQGYYDQGSAYARDYGAPPPPQGYYEEYRGEPSCTRRERQWDRYADRYVVVDVPC
ncbi:hypothetical protein U91I_01362 [alpha proteobacterium U9-1i]|nr:hypothetical protein U91I_01362 [alpha proteobacterium U9-1i]